MQMKHMLASWRSGTEQEYPAYVQLIPHPDEIDLSKIDNGKGNYWHLQLSTEDESTGFWFC